MSFPSPEIFPGPELFPEAPEAEDESSFENLSVVNTWLDSYELFTEVRSLFNGQEIPIDEDSSEVVLDITAASRGRCTLVVNDPSFIPVDATAELAPWGKEVQIWRGIRQPSGIIEKHSLGIYRLDDVELTSDTAGIPITVGGVDRSGKVIEDIFEADGTIAAGTDYITAILGLITAVYPDVQTRFISITAQTPLLTYSEGEDRWAFAQTMAAAIGCDLYFDNDGFLVLELIPTATQSAFISIVEGENGVDVKPALLSLTKRLSRENAHNKWIVVGDNPANEGAPPRAFAVDDDPASPTYYFGVSSTTGVAFGHKPEIFHSSFIADDTQAQQAANGKKAKERGISQQVDFGALVNPELKPNLLVQITRTYTDPAHPSVVIPIVDEVHIVDTLTIPLGPEQSMAGVTRPTLVTA